MDRQANKQTDFTGKMTLFSGFPFVMPITLPYLSEHLHLLETRWHISLANNNVSFSYCRRIPFLNVGNVLKCSWANTWKYLMVCMAIIQYRFVCRFWIGRKMPLISVFVILFGYGRNFWNYYFLLNENILECGIGCLISESWTLLNYPIVISAN